jgi:cysteine desulfuration protein SufE
MFSSCLQKQEKVKELFSHASSLEEKYQIIIDLGKKQEKLLPQDKNDETQVFGCQSMTWMKCEMKDNLLYFQIESEALISAGLGQLLVMIFSGEIPETILKCPPQCLYDLNILKSLSPGRVNGFLSMYNRLKKEALLHINH